MIELRDYQQTAVDAVLREWESVSSTLGVAATGTGKTTIFTEIISRLQPKRAMVIAHREELIFQARERIETQGGLDVEIEMAEQMASTNLFHRTPVVVATVQTLVSGVKRRRMERFDPNDFGLLVIDEFHHATAPSYRAVIDHFKQNPDLKILGVTATPDRADEEALGQIAETVAFEYDILDAVHDGWLVPIDQQFVSVDDLDYSNVRTTAGDLNGADLAAILEAEKTLQGMVGAAIQIIGERQTIMFTATVRQAEMACEIFNRYRPQMAGWISGKTDKEERRKIMKLFGCGDLQVMCNVGCLTEGVDVPAAEIVVMGRPTKSRALYAQMAGRILRPLPNLVDSLADSDERKAAIAESAKPSALIIDFVGNSGRHKLMTSADILGGKASEAAVELALRKAQQSGRPERMNELLDEAEEEILAAEKAERERKRQFEEARRVRLVANVKHTSKYVDPFQAFDIAPARERGWDAGKTLSGKQRALLLKQGIDPDSLGYAQGRQLVSEMFRRWQNHLCTVKQAKLLKRFGYETHDLPMKEASRLIDTLAKNGWKKPVEVAA